MYLLWQIDMRNTLIFFQKLTKNKYILRIEPLITQIQQAHLIEFNCIEVHKATVDSQ